MQKHRETPVQTEGAHAGQALVGFARKDLLVKSGATLRETERLLAVEYGAERLPKLLDAWDLECEDLADVEHWVKVYTELADFTRGLLETCSSSGPPAAGSPVSDQAPSDPRALMLQARLQELHLSYWVERLHRLRTESGSD